MHTSDMAYLISLIYRLTPGTVSLYIRISGISIDICIHYDSMGHGTVCLINKMHSSSSSSLRIRIGSRPTGGLHASHSVCVESSPSVREYFDLLAITRFCPEHPIPCVESSPLVSGLVIGQHKSSNGSIFPRPAACPRADSGGIWISDNITVDVSAWPGQ